MTQTTSPSVTEIASRYIAVWNEAEPAARRAAVESLWAPDGVEFLHETQFRGYDELHARVGRAYDAFVGTGKYTVTGGDDETAHDDIVTFTAHLTSPDGKNAWTARVFILAAPNGQVREDYHVVVKPLPAT
jgi:uncharacterized protein